VISLGAVFAFKSAIDMTDQNRRSAFMGEIIPRWEWRTFGTEKFGEGEAKIRQSGDANVRISGEVYILSRMSMNNTKVRDGLMDIKTLQQVNSDKLEQWMPILKAEFPLNRETISKVFDAFKVEIPDLERKEYTFNQYLKEVIEACDDLVAVRVEKERHGYIIDETIVEIATVTFNDKPFRTIAIEHADPELVINTVRKFGLDGYENINYLRAMKNSVGMEV